MTDGNTGWGLSPGGRGDGQPDRTTLVLGGGLAVALLATLGAVGGYLLAGDVPSETRTATPATAPVATGTTRSPSPSPTTVRTTPPPVRTTAPAGLTVPPLIGTDFEQARDELRKRRLGWRLIFGSGSGRGVKRTVPEAGADVRRGITVLVYVAGPAPALPVPDLVGDDCGEAADDLVEEGFYPHYPVSRTGTVIAQDPPAGTEAHWNDQVGISCGSVSVSPVPGSPSP